MGYYSYLRGVIHIQPPLSAIEADKFREFDFWSISLGDDNASLIPYEDEFKAYYVEENLRTVIDSFPAHTFKGIWEVFGEDNTDIWRVKVNDREIIREDALITWPGGEKVGSNY